MHPSDSQAATPFSGASQRVSQSPQCVSEVIAVSQPSPEAPRPRSWLQSAVPGMHVRTQIESRHRACAESALQSLPQLPQFSGIPLGITAARSRAARRASRRRARRPGAPACAVPPAPDAPSAAAVSVRGFEPASGGSSPGPPSMAASRSRDACSAASFWTLLCSVKSSKSPGEHAVKLSISPIQIARMSRPVT